MTPLLSAESKELPGLRVSIDKLVHYRDPDKMPAERPHAFIYFITIRNLESERVTLLGRKWVLRYADGTQEVIEGESIVGEQPVIAPGGSFTYNSYHAVGRSAVATGSFHGLDAHGDAVYCRIPEFALQVPETPADNPS